MSEIRPELHLWVAYLEKKEQLEEAQDRIAEMEAALRNIEDEATALQARIAELEAALRRNPDGKRP